MPSRVNRSLLTSAKNLHSAYPVPSTAELEDPTRLTPLLARAPAAAAKAPGTSFSHTAPRMPVLSWHRGTLERILEAFLLEREPLPLLPVRTMGHIDVNAIFQTSVSGP